MTERFSRHDGIPGWGHERLRSATVVIIGVGALGNEVARILAMAGAGRLRICDPDMVAESNLSRTILFRAKDIGRYKADAAADALRDLSPGTEVEPIVAPHVNGIGLAALRDADLVISCLDSVAARISLAARCNAVGGGLLDAGTHPWGGQVCYYGPGGACFGCGMSEQQRAVQDDPWSCAAPIPDTAHGASSAIAALVGAWQATSALRILFGLPTAQASRIESVGAVHQAELRRDTACPLHESLDATQIEQIGAVATVQDVLDYMAADEEAFTWASLPDGGQLLRTASSCASLTDLGIARDEILPVARRGTLRADRYFELGERSR
ncbi:HesA/MoeB/ThiF family protein [Catenulispora rubra]|uniref:HesA/MoeB/ThiF family protein n=1 Tax=Catenulispora rubra TaxID=280293 RepID=UPI001E5264FE|nr:ThiF family adenylyltransferase [Catenulispora rubra]